MEPPSYRKKIKLVNIFWWIALYTKCTYNTSDQSKARDEITPSVGCGGENAVQETK